MGSKETNMSWKSRKWPRKKNNGGPRSYDLFNENHEYVFFWWVSANSEDQLMYHAVVSKITKQLASFWNAKNKVKFFHPVRSMKIREPYEEREYFGRYSPGDFNKAHFASSRPRVSKTKQAADIYKQVRDDLATP